MYKMNTTEKIAATISIIILISLVFFIFMIGLKKQEKVNCIKWQEQSQKYSDWYATHWQVEQCKNYNINLK